MLQPPNPRILIIDDEPGVRVILRRVAEREGYETVEADSGADGLLAMAAAPDTVALIFVDLRMPGMDGFAVRATQLATPELARIPTIVVSGQNISPAELDRLKPVACLAKPAALSQLQAAIRCHARMPALCTTHAVA